MSPPPAAAALAHAPALPGPTALPAPTGSGGTRYRLAAGLEWRADAAGGVLFCLRPLMAMRLNRAGAAVIAGLATGENRTAAEIAAAVPPALPPGEAARFLDGLAARRLVVREAALPESWPRVSVIIAAHGRPAATRACVASVLALDYPAGQVEILVVDDASDPPLAPVLDGVPITLIRLDRNRGQSAARNLAAAEATGEVLAFIDNDCTASPGWLRELLPVLAEPAVAIAGGRVTSPPPSGAVAAFEAVRSPLDMGAAAGPVGPRERIAYLPTCNMVVRRDAFLEAGGFAIEMRVGEDVDFAWRVLAAGGQARYAAAGTVTHDHRTRLGALLRRRAEYGASEADLTRRHPRHGRVMYLPRVGLLGLAALLALPLWGPAALVLAGTALVLAGAEFAGKRRRLRRLGVAVPWARLAGSLLREHGAGLYHLGRDATRYYGLPLAALGLAWLPLLPVAVLLLGVPPVVDHRRLRPAVALPVFAGLTWLELAAYQLGVWRGCWARRCARPLLPALRWRR